MTSTNDKENKIYYFAYGSNMSCKRLLNRIKSAIVISKGKLPKHQLKFHKISKDGSSKCDIVETHNSEDIVWGVVYEIDTKDLGKLDSVEGKGYGYERKEVDIILDEGNIVSAKTYYVEDHVQYTKKSLKPNDWYMRHVIYGAIEHVLENDYIKSLNYMSFTVDEDNERRKKELKIYE